MKKITIRCTLGMAVAGLIIASSASAMQVNTNTVATTDQVVTQTQKIAAKKKTGSVVQVTQITKETLFLTMQKVAEKKRADSVAQVTRETLLLAMKKN